MFTRQGRRWWGAAVVGVGHRPLQPHQRVCSVVGPSSSSLVSWGSRLQSWGGRAEPGRGSGWVQCGRAGRGRLCLRLSLTAEQLTSTSMNLYDCIWIMWPVWLGVTSRGRSRRPGSLVGLLGMLAPGAFDWHRRCAESSHT